MTNLSPTPEGLQTVQALTEGLIKLAAKTYGKKTMISVRDVIDWLEENEKIIEEHMAKDEAEKKRRSAEILKMYEPIAPPSQRYPSTITQVKQQSGPGDPPLTIPPLSED